jgi:hypothetical protein
MFYNPHYYTKVVNTDNVRGDFRLERNKKSFNKAWIDHYITKSWTEYLNRLARGNVTKGLRSIDFFFEVNPEMKSMKSELSRNLGFPTIDYKYKEVTNEELDKYQKIADTVIVNLTSYKPRLKFVPLVINSILNQTVKPGKIVLSLYKEDV